MQPLCTRANSGIQWAQHPRCDYIYESMNGLHNYYSRTKDEMKEVVGWLEQPASLGGQGRLKRKPCQTPTRLHILMQAVRATLPLQLLVHC